MKRKERREHKGILKKIIKVVKGSATGQKIGGQAARFLGLISRRPFRQCTAVGVRCLFGLRFCSRASIKSKRVAFA